MDLAQRSFVVLLADNELKIDDAWCRFVANVWQSCQGSPHRCVPFQLTKDACRLDDRLKGVSFSKADHLADAADRDAFVARRLFIELCRYLLNLDAPDDKSVAPIKLFLSHAKFDLDVEPKATRQLIAHLTVDQSVESWFDLGEIPTGSKFADEIAKAVDLILKESLCHLHTKMLLNRFQLAGDEPFVRPPELATLVGRAAGATVLYPDPPVGVEEALLLKKTNVKFTTCLERLATQQSLNGKLIAPSMSESTDLQRCGLDPSHLETTMLELSRYLLIQGATLVYGGHLGSAGYTQKLLELVRTHNDREGVEPFHRIANHRGWPLPRLSVDQLAEAKWVSQTIELPRPADIDESLHPDFTEKPRFFPGDKSPQHRFAWARGMTEMRAFQANSKKSHVCARIVLGGTFGPTVKSGDDGSQKESWYFSRIPGVLEEILLSVSVGQPVFLIGGFGGVAGLVIDLLLGKDRPEATWTYQQQAPFASEMRALYEDRGLGWQDYPEMIESLRAKGIAGINPLLSEDDHRELFETIDSVRMIELVLKELGRLAQVSPPRPAD
ncbi:MAG: hypothetical protein ACKV2Q_24295 [Planctomycetaceae bacterium]